MRRHDQHRLHDLQAWVDVCCAALMDYSHKEAAQLTGLHASTIRRLRTKRVSLFMRFGTVQILAEAAGLRLSIGDTHIKAEAIKKRK